MRRILFLAIGMIAARPALACAVCFGGAEGHEAEAVNAAVITLSSATLLVFSGFGYFAYKMARRIRAFEAGDE